MAGLGPYIAPDISEVPGFADMRNGYYGKFRVGAHIGIPLRRADGSLFGTICALDPDPQPQAIVNHLPELQLLATCLSTILEAETKYQDEQRRRERAEQAALSDDLTNCLNRRGWEIEVRREEARCRRYGGSSGVIVIDLDDFKRINDTRGHAAGDEILRDTARILSRSARTSDMIARIGGDEFAVLCVGAGNEGIHHLAGRISENLHAAGIKASVGWAVREPNHSIEDAFTAADRMMYSHKQLSKNTGGDSLGLH
jgi:diguanylate cyclase (GGDEF)-like protein